MAGTLTKYNNEYVVYSYLMQKGYSLAQTCGILANIESESSFNPEALNTREQAYGICQWRDGRRSTLHSLYGNRPSISQQVAYITYELNSSESKARGYIQVDNTRNGAYIAGREFADKYERCASQYDIPRANRAMEFWDHYTNTKGVNSDMTFVDISEEETPTTNLTVSTSPGTYGGSLATIDPYKNYVSSNLSRVTASGFDYGYLIDMTYGGEFKFYIPEFSESAGAVWEDVVIPGRSVTIKSYNHTNSRGVTISLDLYAGVGLYNSGEDVVGDMHKDINFVKSLEYPDYGASNAIATPPATVHLILGSALNIEGVVSDVRAEHMKPLDAQNRSMYVKLSFTVTQNVDNPPDRNDIRNGVSAVLSTENPSTLQ